MADTRWTDFAWVNDTDVGMDLDVCCLSVITDATVEAVFASLPPTLERFAATADQLDNRMMEGETVLGLLAHDANVIMFEPNGFLGNLSDVMRPIAVGRTAATYYFGGHGVSGFRWWADDRLVADFEPAIPVFEPDLPEELRAAMRGIGGFSLYDADGDDAPEPDWDSIHTTEACLALIQTITGVRLTKVMLRDSTYAGAVVGPIPGD